jgi:hypothetical protein
MPWRVGGERERISVAWEPKYEKVHSLNQCKSCSKMTLLTLDREPYRDEGQRGGGERDRGDGGCYIMIAS